MVSLGNNVPPKEELLTDNSCDQTTLASKDASLAATQIVKPQQQDPSAGLVVGHDLAKPAASRLGESPVSDQGAPTSELATEKPSRPTQRGALFLEIFAGTARMSKAFTRLGFQVLAVDSVKPPGVPGLCLDLSKPLSQKLILDLIRSRRLAAVHLAPPCGTSSAARAIYAGPQSPKPLRSPA